MWYCKTRPQILFVVLQDLTPSLVGTANIALMAHIPLALGWEWLTPHPATHQRQRASVMSGLADCLRFLGDTSLYGTNLAGVTGLRPSPPQRSR